MAMEFTPYYRLNKCRGIDQHEPSRIPEGFLKRGVNIDISDTFKISRRLGKDIVYSGSVHSIWPKTDLGLDYSLFCEGGALKKITTAYVVTTLLSGLDPTAEMDYVDIYDRVYFTNGVIIGYIQNNTAYSLPVPTDPFKVPLKPGYLIESFDNRIYTAKENVLSFSDAVFINQMDARFNKKQLDGMITMLKAVDNGLYLSAGGTTYFAKGLDPHEMQLIPVAKSGAKWGSAVKVRRERFTGDDRRTKNVVWWTSEEGSFVGSPGGEVKNATGGHYKIPDKITRMVSLFREDKGYGQYMGIYSLEPGIGGIVGSTRIPNLTTSATGAVV